MSTNFRIRPRIAKTLIALTAVTTLFSGVSIAAQASTGRASAQLAPAATQTPLIQKPSDFGPSRVANQNRRG